VLDLLAFVGRTLAAELTTATWTVLLRTMLGVADALLGASGGSSGSSGGGSSVPSMADELCPHLLRVRSLPSGPRDRGRGTCTRSCARLVQCLVELWLRSGMRQIDMWDNLQVRACPPPRAGPVRV
jgi:hypothetical protein